MEPERASPWVVIGAWIGAIIFAAIAFFTVINDPQIRPALETDWSSLIVFLVFILICGATGALAVGIPISIKRSQRIPSHLKP